MINTKRGERYLCPNCNHGKDRIIESGEGYYLCGLCKGKGWVYSVDESYSKYSRSIFSPRKCLIDVVRIRGLEQPDNYEEETQTALKIGYTFLGYKPYYKTLIQNDVN